MKVGITQKNSSWMQEFKKRLDKETSKVVAVGYPTGKGGLSNPHYDGGASIIDVAIANNFGTETQPRRPFMDQAAPKLKKEWVKLLKQTQKLINAGRISTETVMKTAGLKSVSIIQAEILDGGFIPNSAETIEKKGSSTPLVDSGDMRKYANFIVRKA